MNQFERNCKLATELVAGLNLGEIHCRNKVYWAGSNLQLTYLREKNGKLIGKNWKRHEEIACKKLWEIKRCREAQGSQIDRIKAVLEELKTFLPEAKISEPGYYHLRPDSSGDEAVVLCGRGFSQSPGASTIWISLYDGWKAEADYKDPNPSFVTSNNKHYFERGMTPGEILAVVMQACVASLNLCDLCGRKIGTKKPSLMPDEHYLITICSMCEHHIYTSKGSEYGISASVFEQRDPPPPRESG